MMVEMAYSARERAHQQQAQIAAAQYNAMRHYVRTPEEMAEMARGARNARQAAEPPAGDVIDGEYTVVDVPLLGPPDE